MFWFQELHEIFSSGIEYCKSCSPQQRDYNFSEQCFMKVVGSGGVGGRGDNIHT